MKRHPRSFWEQLVAELEAGATIVDVARRHRVREVTLGWWRTELRRATRLTSLRLVPVNRRAEDVSKGHVEVAIGAAVIRADEGADVEYIAALARALRDVC